MNPWTDRRAVRTTAITIATVALGVAVAGSFAFGHRLAQLAGASPVQAWLWPIAVGGTVFEIAFCFVMLGTLPYRTGFVRRWFWVQMFAAVAGSVWGNAFLAAKPDGLADTTSALIGIVPAGCLLLIMLNTVLYLNATNLRGRGQDVGARPSAPTSDETNPLEP
ncbi:DUF2637 domain-containing protein [Nocardia niigatensis]